MGYAIIWEPPAGVIKRYYGEVTGDELLESVLQTEGDLRFDVYRYVINDFTDCTALSVSEDVLEEIAAIDKAAYHLNPRIGIAIVATHPQTVAAAEAYVNSPLRLYPTQIFSSMEEARRWLNESSYCATH